MNEVVSTFVLLYNIITVYYYCLLICDKKVMSGMSAAEVEKVSDPGSLVPRNFFESKFSQKISQKCLRFGFSVSPSYSI